MWVGGYSPLRLAGPASPARRAPRPVPAAPGVPGSLARRVLLHPLRGRGSRARPGCLAVMGMENGVRNGELSPVLTTGAVR